MKISIVSSIISYRAASIQLQKQLEDKEQDRQHQMYLAIVARRQQAIEDIWALIFNMERRGSLKEDELDKYIRSLMWLPSDLRSACLKVLESFELHRSDKDAKLPQVERLAELRHNLAIAAQTIRYQ